MSATIVREKRQTTIPVKVSKQAGIEVGDTVEWSFENGLLVVRKLVQETPEELDIKDVDPRTLLPRAGKITAESIVRAVRTGRDREK